MNSQPIVFNGIYKHFKGNFYKLLYVAVHSETRKKHIVYQALYGDYTIYIRPIDMFFEDVDRYGSIKPRFEYQEDKTGKISC